MRAAALLFATAITSAALPALAESQPTWAESFRSPRPAPAPDARDAELLASCGAGDAALHEVAARITMGELSVADAEALRVALRRSGDPHVRPRAWMLRGMSLRRATAKERLRAWLASFGETGERRCGIASSKGDDERDVFVAVVIDAQGDLAPMPSRVRPGDWITFDARIRVPSEAAKVVVLGPTGAPHSVLTSFSGNRARARFRADRPGRWMAQLLIEGEAGPQPILETVIFAGTEPFVDSRERAPGETMGGEALAPEDALTTMVNLARASERLAPLVRDSALDELARAHALRMRATNRTAHDVGDGRPHERIEREGIVAKAIGENVAHAASVALAHRALWASPSHRGNLLDPRFQRVGIGVVPDKDGSLWIAQIFAGN